MQKVLTALVLFVVTCGLLIFPAVSLAQLDVSGTDGSTQSTSSVGVAISVPLNDKNVKSGDIVSFTPQGYALSKQLYDQSVVGVVTDNPSIMVQINNGGTTFAIATSGVALVNVSAANGSIKQGDLITSSTTPGIGVKATRTGFVLGTAMDSFSSDNPKDIGQVPVSLNIHYFYSTKETISQIVSDLINLAALSLTDQPSAVIRYIVAALTLVIAVAAGFFSFIRVARYGVEALGRNPLASRMIQLGIIFNVVITVTIILAGVVVSYLIIRL